MSNNNSLQFQQQITNNVPINRQINNVNTTVITTTTTVNVTMQEQQSTSAPHQQTPTIVGL